MGAFFSKSKADTFALLTPRLRGPRAAALSNTPLKNPALVPYCGNFFGQNMFCQRPLKADETGKRVKIKNENIKINEAAHRDFRQNKCRQICITE